MKPVFADTSFFIALLNPKDKLHRKARELAGNHKQFVTTDYVLIELANSFSLAGEKHLFLEFHTRLSSSPYPVIVEASRHLTRLGIERFRDRADKNWSLTDCISFVVMEQQSLNEALSADHHFQQAGFTALMKS